VLVVGSVALDTIHTPGGSAEEVLGGSASYFALAASHLTTVRMVAVVGEDFPQQYRTLLREAGVDLQGLETRPGRTFRWEGSYAQDFVHRDTLRTELNVFREFRPRVPEAYRETPVVFLANIDPELQELVLEQVRRPRWVVLDTMNFWLEGAKREVLLRLLPKVNALLVDHTEARLLSRRHHLGEAARWIQDQGPRIVVVKRGDAGALVRWDQRWRWVPPYPTARVVDPTGAGDTFAAGWIGALARWGWDGAEAHASLLVGAAAASLAIEGFGAQSLVRMTTDRLMERARELREMADYPALPEEFAS
jgi:sugar/nucleoside kinase (ribokinase family)